MWALVTSFLSGKAKIIVFALLGVVAFALVTYIMWLRAELAEEMTKSFVYEESYKTSQMAIAELTKNQEAINTAVLEIQDLRDSLKAQLDQQKHTLGELIKTNETIKEWANVAVPQEIKTLLRSKPETGQKGK